MKNIDISKLKLNNIIHDGEGCTIYDIGDNMLAKIIKPVIFDACNNIGINYERKLRDDRTSNISEIVSPISIIYSNNTCIGYTMKKINGLSINKYVNSDLFNKNSFKDMTNLYLKIENIVKKANELGIVMPDLCTYTNTLVTKDGNIFFIDYDGLQLGKNDKSICIAQALGNHSKYLYNFKYCKKLYSFTKELDKTSLTVLLFLLMFDFNISIVGTINPMTNEIIKVEDVFNLLNIDDELFMDKIKINLSDDKEGIFLGDELKNLQEKYDTIFPQLGCKSYIKKIKKY